MNLLYFKNFLLHEDKKKSDGEDSVEAAKLKGTDKGIINMLDTNFSDMRKGMSTKTALLILGEVFARGHEAYNNNRASVRPHVQSPDQWAYARVKGFLNRDEGTWGSADSDLAKLFQAAQKGKSITKNDVEKKNDGKSVKEN